jgi:hypothetical protein
MLNPGVDLPEVPILAKQTVKGTRAVKDGQVVIAAPLMTGADPIGDAVGGQRVAVPVKQPPPGRAGQMSQPALTNGSQAAKAPLPLADLTAMSA